MFYKLTILNNSNKFIHKIMSKRTRDSIDGSNRTMQFKEVEHSNTSSHLTCPLQMGFQYLGGRTSVDMYNNCGINNNNSNDSPSQSPIKGGKRYRFTSSMKRVDKISKDLNLCDFIEDEGEEVNHHTSKSF